MIAPNTLLQNRYLVQKQIGQGGMGAVYIATDQRFGSTVALKETFFNDPGLRKAFEREARLLNHLRHPALPRVSDHFMEDEGQFLVMEYIPGDDLAEKLNERGGAFPLSEVLNWADQLLDALDYLHTQEPPVIHRDIKPQNLKLTSRNHIVLLDFGLAKGTPAQTKVTATGSVFGYSRHYAPLEQIQGAGTDPRSDLYSLAATLYHMMTGVTPAEALMRATAVLNGQPDPLRPANEVHPQVTPAVAEVISKAMAQNASQRPQTAAAMREMLREAARQSHTVSRDTNALPKPSTNVYEQDTQLMFSGAHATNTNDVAEETGTVKESASATAVSSTPLVSEATSTDAPGSVVTKVAASQPTTLKNQPGKRIIAIAASAVVLIAVAAAVYTFTRNNTPTPATPESVQSVPTAPETINTENQNNQQPAETTAETENQSTSTPTASPQAPRQASVPSRPTRVVPQPAPQAEPEEAEAENEPPEPPNVGPNGVPLPRRPIRRLPRPGEPGFEEAIRIEQQRRAAEATRQATQEQRRILLERRREILERQRQRRQQQRYP